MSEQELKTFLKAVRELHAANTATPEKARQFLKDEGFLTKDGTVAEPYAEASREAR